MSASLGENKRACRSPFTLHVVACTIGDVRKDIVDILACPMDKSPLELSVDQENGDEVIQGSLKCTQCGEVYPIEDRIPNLLPPDMRKPAAT